jgi:hypothetical protein
VLLSIHASAAVDLRTTGNELLPVTVNVEIVNVEPPAK